MKKHIALFTLVAAALIAAPASVRAEDKTPATTEAKPKKNTDATAYHAKVTAVDAAGSTITLGELKLSVTAETKISKDGKPATLADFAAGDDARGSYKTDANGNKTAVSLRTGQKAPAGPKKKKAAQQ